MPVPEGQITGSQIWTTPEGEVNESTEEIQEEESNTSNSESVLPEEKA